MTDALRYRIIDEPVAGRLQRFALPPILAFLAANLFLPWGWLLVAYNSLALNGRTRNRELAMVAAAIGIYFASSVLLDALIAAQIIAITHARYLFVLAIGSGLVLTARAYIGQAETADLRKYLARD